MRDPFESSPALRLGDAKAKPREASFEGEEIAGPSPLPEALREPRPPSLAPEFGDAFGAAFSKPQDRLVPAKPAEGERRAYSFADVAFSISGTGGEISVGPGLDGEGITITFEPEEQSDAADIEAFAKLVAGGSLRTLYGDEIAAALAGNLAHETLGARVDDVVITGVVRKSVGDGAMRYEPRGFVEIRPEVLSAAEFKRRAREFPPIDHGDTSPVALLHNHAALVAKKDAEK